MGSSPGNETRMNELNRMRYLQAMGVDAYVSRSQLPGALPTRRLALVAQVPQAPAPPAAQPRGKPGQIPQLDVVEKKPQARQPDAPTQAPIAATPAVRVSLAAVFCAGIAWVESLDDRPLAREQVHLIRAMARAVHDGPASPKVAQFDWPIHNNPQLDQGESAAKAALAAFIQRHIDEQKCRALVVLGKDTGALFEGAQLGGITRVVTHSTLQMIEQTAVKRQVWADLQPLVLRA